MTRSGCGLPAVLAIGAAVAVVILAAAFCRHSMKWRRL